MAPKHAKQTNPTAGGKRRPRSAIRPGTKTAKLLRLLKRPGGASLAELTKATGWQAHSVRGFLSGAVKAKMRLKVTSAKREDGERAYRVWSEKPFLLKTQRIFEERRRVRSVLVPRFNRVTSRFNIVGEPSGSPTETVHAVFVLRKIEFSDHLMGEFSQLCDLGIAQPGRKGMFVDGFGQLHCGHRMTASAL